MKKKLIAIGSAILVIIVAAIIAFMYMKNRIPQNAEETYEYFKSIKAYSCSMRIKIKNSREDREEYYKQYYDYLQGYRLEISDNTVQIYKGENIYVQDLKNNARYTLEKNFDELFKYTFLGEYINLMYVSEDMKYICKNIEGKTYSVVELIIPGNNKNMEKAILYIDNQGFIPEKLIIYDARGNERVQVIYEDFVVEDQLDKNLFKE